MPNDVSGSSLLISSGVTMIAAFLGLRQWYERRARELDLPAADRRYFFRQDVLRGVGVVVMLLLAVGLYIGSRLPPKVGDAANLVFIQVWMAISGLIVVMLVLALLDWIGTRRYAQRQRRYLASERRRILRETLAAEPGDPAPDSERRLDA